jgi:putative glutamine amidotransferase
MRLHSLWYNDYAHLEKVFPDAQRTFNPLSTQIQKGDIVIFHGGTDVSSHLYGEVPSKYNQHPDHNRDTYEKHMYESAVAVGAFCYGICRGAQLLCVLNGGKLIQHIHDGSHTMRRHKLDDRPFSVNSDHHQAMLPSGNYETIAKDGDIYEMLWYPDSRTFCVQAHPEWCGEQEPFVVFVNDFIKEKMK